MKAVLLSLGLLCTAAAFAAYDMNPEDVTGGAYEATTGATGGLGATMGTEGGYGVYGRPFMSRWGRGGRFDRGRMSTQIVPESNFTGSDVGTTY
jgi:hypothetical protein